MPQGWEQLSDTGVAFGAALLLCSAMLAGLVVIRLKRRDPIARERRRRLEVNRRGRITSGVVLDIEDGLIHYQYAIGAVDYAACQDISAVADLVGDDPKGVVGSAAIKYHQKNPYNSIIVCEDWSGLRAKRPPAPHS